MENVHGTVSRRSYKIHLSYFENPCSFTINVLHGGNERIFLYVTFADFRCPIPLCSAAQEVEPCSILRARMSIKVGPVTFLVNAWKRRGNEVSLTVRGFVFGFVGAL